MLCILPCLPHWWHLEGEVCSAFPTRTFPGLTGLDAGTCRDEGMWQNALQASRSRECRSPVQYADDHITGILLLSYDFIYFSLASITTPLHKSQDGWQELPPDSHRTLTYVARGVPLFITAADSSSCSPSASSIVAMTLTLHRANVNYRYTRSIFLAFTGCS